MPGSGCGAIGGRLRFAGGLRLIKRFLSPLLVGIVIMMVGLGLWPVLNDFIGVNWHIAIAVFVVAVAASSFLGKMARTMAVIREE